MNTNKPIHNVSVAGTGSAQQLANKRLKTSQIVAPIQQKPQAAKQGQEKSKGSGGALVKGAAGSTIQSSSLTKKNLEDWDRANNNDSKLFSAAGAASSTATDFYDQLSEDGKRTTKKLLSFILRAH